MSTLNEKQYRAVSYDEVAYNKPLTVRIAQDTARNINNFKAHVGNHKLINDIWPIEEGMNSWMHFYNMGGFGGIMPTSELIRQLYPPMYVSPGYTRMLVQSVHQRYVGSGSTTWRLYAVDSFLGSLFSERDIHSWPAHSDGGARTAYNWIIAYVLSGHGQVDIRFDSNDFPGYAMHSWVTSSDSYAMESNVFNCSVRDPDGDIYFILTCQNSDLTTLSRLLTLDVTPMVAS
jgi:hypothetical protein